MTRAVFEAKTKDDLKYFVALARRQGIVVKYLRVSLVNNPKIQKQYLSKSSDTYLDKINKAEIYNKKHEHQTKSWSELKNEYGV